MCVCTYGVHASAQVLSQHPVIAFPVDRFAAQAVVVCSPSSCMLFDFEALPDGFLGHQPVGWSSNCFELVMLFARSLEEMLRPSGSGLFLRAITRIRTREGDCRAIAIVSTVCHALTFITCKGIVASGHDRMMSKSSYRVGFLWTSQHDFVHTTQYCHKLRLSVVTPLLRVVREQLLVFELCTLLLECSSL